MVYITKAGWPPQTFYTSIHSIQSIMAKKLRKGERKVSGFPRAKKGNKVLSNTNKQTQNSHSKKAEEKIMAKKKSKPKKVKKKNFIAPRTKTFRSGFSLKQS